MCIRDRFWNGGSVPCCRATRNWIGVSRAFHSASVRRTAVLLMSITTLEGRPQADISPGLQAWASGAAEWVGEFGFIFVMVPAWLAAAGIPLP